jgi:hypothetical protein
MYTFHPTFIDPTTQMRACDVETFSRAQDAIDCYKSTLNVHGIDDVKMMFDHRGFLNLKDYISALNVEAEWAQANTQKTDLLKISECLSCWETRGITCPYDMSMHLKSLETQEDPSLVCEPS